MHVHTGTVIGDSLCHEPPITEMGRADFKNVQFFSRKCNVETLVYDEACLEIAADESVSLWRQYSKCDGCDLERVLTVDGTNSALIRTVWPVSLSVRDESGLSICNKTYFFGEYGRYGMNVTKGECSPIAVIEQPDEALFPLLVAVVTILSIATLWYLVKGAYKRVVQWEMWNRVFRRGEDADLLVGTPTSPIMRRTSTRLRSADVFRGFVIASMIFVNYGGGGYTMLKHTPWNGLTFADLIFPWFAWLMGFALCLSLHTRLRTAMKRRTAFFQIVKRSLILILLGIIMSSKGYTIEDLRIPGVLQRLGLSYLIVGTLECIFIDASNNYSPGTAIFRDLRATAWQWVATVILITIHTTLTFLLKVPNCPRGYLGPGGLHNHSFAENCTGGAAGYVDIVVFGESHLHRGGSFRSLYQAKAPFDPEGLLGTLTCALVVQFGLQAARILLAYSHARARLLRWFVWGVILGLSAGGLCTFSANGGPIPVNKNLWSLSYCMAASSLAFLILAFLYSIIDVYALWEGRPFYYAGRNSLLLYIGHSLMEGRFPFEWKLDYPSHMEILAMNSLAVILWLAISVFLHKKNVILAL